MYGHRLGSHPHPIRGAILTRFRTEKPLGEREPGLSQRSGSWFWGCLSGLATPRIGRVSVCICVGVGVRVWGKDEPTRVSESRNWAETGRSGEHGRVLTARTRETPYWRSTNWSVGGMA